MTTNMGFADRVIRLLLAAVLIVLWALNILNGTVAVIGLVIAGIFLLTSFAGRCPLYTACGVNTRPKKV